MRRVSISSDLIRSAGYDVRERILEVEFTHGAVYHYLGVPVEVFEDLLLAPSAGRFFCDRIRSEYAFERIGNHV